MRRPVLIGAAAIDVAPMAVVAGACVVLTA